MWPLTSYGCPGSGCALSLAGCQICTSFRPLARARPVGSGLGDVPPCPCECPSSKAAGGGEHC